MAKTAQVVNGYQIPQGLSGVAVRAACEYIIQNPGASQSSVLSIALGASQLNASHAAWITSPGPKSPATLLWERRKEKVFRCYPNEHTSQVVGSEAALREIVTDKTVKSLKVVPAGLRAGDLVRCRSQLQWGEEARNGIFLGYAVGHVNVRGYGTSCVFEYNLTGGAPTLSPTVEDLMTSLKTIFVTPKFCLFMQVMTDIGIVTLISDNDQLTRI